MKCEKNIFTAVVLFIVFILNFSLAEAKKVKTYALKTDSPQAATKQIESILKNQGLDLDHVSLEIRDEADEVLADIHAKEKKTPASISKLLTSYAVLKKFPLGSKFLTQVYRDQKNLYLKGGGDPSFVSENMWFLANQLTRSNLKGLTGDIIVDDYLFDQVRFDESREDKRVDRAYDSPVGAMSFNWNAVNVFVKPTRPGEKAQVVIDPENGYFELKNKTETVARLPKKELVISISNSEKTITVSGEISANNAEKAIFKSVSEPDLWSGVNLAAFLKQRGILMNGAIKHGVVPADAELLATFESKNLSYILADMNKFSNNFVAEMLTKNLAAQQKLASSKTSSKIEASLKEGVDIIRSTLIQLGLNNNDFEISNPSGFTRQNRLSAYALNKVLVSVKNDFTLYPTLLESLPIAGIDGTLKKRMKESVAEGYVRAKTGFLNGVVTMAGYAGRKDGRVYTFSFLYNGPRDEHIVREAFDQILVSSLK